MVDDSTLYVATIMHFYVYRYSQEVPLFLEELIIVRVDGIKTRYRLWNIIVSIIF